MNVSEEHLPMVTQTGALDMQVCVPTSWTDEEIRQFANRERMCGTTNGWQLRRQGHKGLAGADERVPCSRRGDYVHVMLDA